MQENSKSSAEDLWMGNVLFQPRPPLAFQLTWFHFHEPLGGPAGVIRGLQVTVEPKEGTGGPGNCGGWGVQSCLGGESRVGSLATTVSTEALGGMRALGGIRNKPIYGHSAQPHYISL